MISNDTKKLLSLIITVGIIAKTGMTLNERTKTFSELGIQGMTIVSQKDEKFNAKTFFPVVSKKTEQFKSIKKDVPITDANSMLDSKFIPSVVKSVPPPPMVGGTNIPIPPDAIKVETPEELQLKNQQKKEQDDLTELEKSFVKQINVEGIINSKIVINGDLYSKGAEMKDFSQKIILSGKEVIIIPKLLNFTNEKIYFEFNNKPIDMTWGVSKHE